jgi:serralysin
MANSFKLGNEFLINTYTTNNQQNPSVTGFSDGSFVVTWESIGQDTSGYGVYGQRYKADGTKNGEEFKINTRVIDDQNKPSITGFSDGSFVVTWQSDSQDGSQEGIYGQRYNADGTANGGEFLINTDTDSHQQNPSVTELSGGGFVVTWNSEEYYSYGNGYGNYDFDVSGQRYNADGTANGTEFKINTTTASDQQNPSVTELSDGGFVVTWESYYQDGSGWGVYGQRYNAGGTANGNEFKINTTTTFSQLNPSVTELSDGGFVVTWQSSGQDGPGWGVYGQRYNDDGTTNGNEFQINTTTASDQLNPSVTELSDGGFVVTWQSSGQDGSVYGVYGQRYNADGTTNGTEFPINTTTDSHQQNPSVTELSDGNVVVAWESFNQDGSGSGVYGQRLDFNRDEFTATPQQDEFNGGKGNDLVNATLANLKQQDTIDGGTDKDTLKIIDGNATDYVNINLRNPNTSQIPSIPNTLISNFEKFDLSGFAGATNFIGSGYGDDVMTGAGNDAMNGYEGNDTMSGGAGNDYMSGDSGTDSMAGGAGDDTIYGYDNNDTMSGGDGDDTYKIYNNSNIIEAENEGTDTVEYQAFGNFNYTLSDNVENLTFMEGGEGNIQSQIVTGNNLDNVITGNAQDNYIDGKVGEDTLVGGSGNDIYKIDNAKDVVEETSEGEVTSAAMTSAMTIMGMMGGGNSWSSVPNVSEFFANFTSQLDLTKDLDVAVSSIDYTLPANVEILQLTDEAATGTGNELNNVIFGSSYGDDIIEYNFNQGPVDLFENTLDGGIGADTMVGGVYASTTYIVDNKGDRVIEKSNYSYVLYDPDTVKSSINYTLGTNLERLILTGNGDIQGYGNNLNNYIVGNTGKNSINGGAGVDYMYGGAGNDIYAVDNIYDYVGEGNGYGYGGGGGIDKINASIHYTLNDYSEVENLTLTGKANLKGTGNTLDNTIMGNVGNNMLKGGDGKDTLKGVDGNDTLDGGAGNDSLVGGMGDDTYTVDSSADTIVEVANEGSDTVETNATYTLDENASIENLTLTGTADINGTGSSIANKIMGNAGNNHLKGMAGNDTIKGAAGNDTLDGGAGTDSLVGEMGDDTYKVDDSSDVIVEAANEGSDTVETNVTYTLSENASLENLTLTGTADIDGTGSSIANVIMGNSGNNTLDGKAGNDTLKGGAGDDIYQVDSTSDTIEEKVNEGTDTVRSKANYTLDANVEKLILVGTGEGGEGVTGTGNALANTITGNELANTLDGKGGIDTLKGGAGDDIYIVDDLAILPANSTEPVETVEEQANEGMDLVKSSVAYNLRFSSNVENLNLTGSASVIAYGNDLDNVINGNSGNNAINGGLGKDTMNGGNGNDIYALDVVDDVVTENANEGTADKLYAGFDYTLGDNIEILGLTGTSNINGTGNTLANQLIGNTGDNKLNGGAGLDTMAGGDGNDTYIIDSTGVNADKITESANTSTNTNTGTDVVKASASYTLVANVENLTLTGSSNGLYGIGNSLNNAIAGNSGESVLIGGAGNDTLTGGSKNDILTGGDGNDRFVFDTDAAFAGNNIDVIADFVTATDKIVLDKTTFTALTSAAGNWSATSNEFAIVANDALAGASTKSIVYSSSTGRLFYNQNGSATTGLNGLGDGGQFAELSENASGNPILVASDFIIQA